MNIKLAQYLTKPCACPKVLIACNDAKSLKKLNNCLSHLKITSEAVISHENIWEKLVFRYVNYPSKFCCKFYHYIIVDLDFYALSDINNHVNPYN